MTVTLAIIAVIATAVAAGYLAALLVYAYLFDGFECR